MILVLLGPTASGKTDLACRLADELPLDLISMDSVMVYKGMNIGTAKPSAAELDRYPHHLIDIRDPTETYSAADFVHDADALVQQSLQQNRIPLIVGGTMLYARAFRDGMADLPSADAQVRARILDRANKIGWPALHQQLADMDPEAAAGIHPNNHQRVQRALEVIEISGRPLSHQWRESGTSATVRLGSAVLEVCVHRERQIVHQHIEQRFDAMLARGFVDEVRQLHARTDMHARLPSMRAVGYRQIWQYLNGEIDANEMRERALAATRALAKKQQTWLRAWDHVARLNGSTMQMAQEVVRRLDQLIA